MHLACTLSAGVGRLGVTTHAVIPFLLVSCTQADKRARQKAKEKERKDGKAAGCSTGHGVATGAADSFDDELAAAMAEAATISSRLVPDLVLVKCLIN